MSNNTYSMGEIILYNIVLNGIKPNFDLLLQEDGLKYVKQLSCENADLIEQKTYPVIICRYAGDVEVEFYKEIAEKHGLIINAVVIPDADNAFKTFDAHVKQNEQEDLHLKSKIEVIKILENGLNLAVRFVFLVSIISSASAFAFLKLDILVSL